MADETQEHNEHALIEGVTLEAGKSYEVTRTFAKGKIKFQLMGEQGVGPLKDQDFTLTGQDLSHSGKTDADGVYEHAEELLFGDYTLQVGEASYLVQADPEDAPPQVLSVPVDAREAPTDPEGPPEGDEEEPEDDEDEDRPLKLTGSVGSGGDNKPDDVQAVKQKLKDLGFDWVTVNTTSDSDLIRAIKLFQAIKNGHRSFKASDDGLVSKDGATHDWLEATNAPKWVQLSADGPGYKNHDKTQNGGNGGGHDYGTEWAEETIKAAAAKYKADYLDSHEGAALIQINDVSKAKGGDTPNHKGHESGLDIDIRVPRTDGECGTSCTASAYDRDAMRAILKAFEAQDRVTKIYFNDATLISEGLCKKVDGHSDHAHINLSPPARQAP